MLLDQGTRIQDLTNSRILAHDFAAYERKHLILKLTVVIFIDLDLTMILEYARMCRCAY